MQNVYIKIQNQIMNVEQLSNQYQLFSIEQHSQIQQLIEEKLSYYAYKIFQAQSKRQCIQVLISQFGVQIDENLTNEVQQSQQFDQKIIETLSQLIKYHKRQIQKQVVRFEEILKNEKAQYLNKKQLIEKKYEDKIIQMTNIIKRLQQQIKDNAYRNNIIIVQKDQELRSMQKKLSQNMNILSQLKQEIQRLQFQKIQQQTKIRASRNQNQVFNLIINAENQNVLKYSQSLEITQILAFEVEEHFSKEKISKLQNLLSKNSKFIKLMNNIKDQIAKQELQFDKIFMNQTNFQETNTKFEKQMHNQLQLQIKRYKDKVQYQVKKLVQIINTIKQENKLLKDSNENYLVQEDLSKKHIQRLLIQNQQMKGKLQNLYDKIKEMSEKNQNIKIQKQGLKQKTLEHLQQLLKIKEKIQTKKRQKQQSEQKLISTKYQLQKCQNNLIQISTKYQEGKIEIKSLKEILDTFRNCKQSQNHQKQIIQQMIQKSYSIRMQNKQLHQKITKNTQTIIQYQNLINQLKQTLEFYRVEQQRFENKIINFSEECCLLKQKNTSLSIQIEQIKKSLKNSITKQEFYVQKLQQASQQLLKQKALTPRNISPIQKVERQNQFLNEQDLNKTINLRCEQQLNSYNDSKQDKENLEATSRLKTEDKEKYVKNISRLNEIINYMVNYIKGYTRNGIRNKCWIVNLGNKYMKKALSGQNMKLKYENFEKIRQISETEPKCKQLIRNFEKIMDYYFVNQ